MGSEHVERFTVEGDLATDVGGPLPQRVLSLAGMVVRIEPACATLASARLDTGATSVGAVVSLRDVGAVEGTQCETRASLSDGGDGRRLRFDVECPLSSVWVHLTTPPFYAKD